MIVEPIHRIKIFVSYAHKDEDFREELEKHLSAQKRLKRITTWFDRQILAGADWEHEIEARLDTADVILLLVSADFISSNYCYGIEMQRALDRSRAGTVRVIPIILRAVDGWEDTPIGSLNALPTGGKPVTLWKDRDEAWRDVVRGIREAVSRTRLSWVTPTASSSSSTLFVTAYRQDNSSPVPTESSGKPVLVQAYQPTQRVSVSPDPPMSTYTVVPTESSDEPVVVQVYQPTQRVSVSPDPPTSTYTVDTTKWHWVGWIILIVLVVVGLVLLHSVFHLI